MEDFQTKLFLKKKVKLAKKQERLADVILDHFGIDGVLTISYIEDPETGKSVTMISCVQTGEMLRFEMDRPQSQYEIVTLIPNHLSQLLLNGAEGSFANGEHIDSIDRLFEVAGVIKD